MKKLLNVLYVTSEGAYLHREGESLKIEKDSKLLLQVPIHTLQGIVCLNRAIVSPQLMKLCAERQILHFLLLASRRVPSASAGRGHRQRASAPDPISLG